MAYGFTDKAVAERKASQLTNLNPLCRFDVQAHSWAPNNAPLTWGVYRYRQYDDRPDLGWIGAGFVWFPA